MTMTPAQQRAIIAKESAWIDADQFSPLDLSAFPSLAPPPPSDTHDDRWAKDWRDTALSASATALRQFVSDPDTESLERVAAEIGHEGFRDEVRQRKGETTAEQFKRACPSYIPTTHNYELIAQTLSFNALSANDQSGDIQEQVAALIDGGHWTVENLTRCYHALTREGLLDVAVGSARNLSTAERLKVTRLAQAGHVDQAIGEYLKCALDGEEPGMELLDDPAYRQVCDEAVWSVFADITNDYVPTAEREAYLQRHCAGRPLTLALLQSAWAACQKHEASYARSELLDQFQRPEETPPPSIREIDALDDTAVENLYRASLREYVRSIKAPGVLA